MKNLLTVLLLISLAGCTSVPTTLEVAAAPIERPALVLPAVDVISARPVEWIIITPDNAEQVFSELKTDNSNIVVFALTSDGYENLSLNIAELMKLTKQQRAIIIAQQNYYETEN